MDIRLGIIFNHTYYAAINLVCHKRGCMVLIGRVVYGWMIRAESITSPYIHAWYIFMKLTISPIAIRHLILFNFSLLCNSVIA